MAGLWPNIRTKRVNDMCAVKVFGLQAQLVAPVAQAKNAMSQTRSASSNPARDASEHASADKTDTRSTHSRHRARRSAASESALPQWLHTMSQAMANEQRHAVLPGVALGAQAKDETHGDADGDIAANSNAIAALSGDAAHRALGFPADLFAMQTAPTLIPTGAVLPVLGKAASATHEASQAQAVEGTENEETHARGTEHASASQAPTPQRSSALLNQASAAAQHSNRAVSSEAQPQSQARLTERIASGAHQEAATGADSGARSEPQAVVNSSSTSSPGIASWSALGGLQTSGATEWMPVALKGCAPQGWQGQLMDALGERVEVQMKHGIDNAVIRLDPPMLGSVQIDIRHENGALQVHLVATHEEVARQLETISRALQNELAQKQYTNVAVVVRNGGSMGQGESRGQRESEGGHESKRAPGRALDDALASSTDHNHAGV
jgi:flagellar hook-length control protein FliK